MSAPWTFSGEPVWAAAGGSLTLIEGSSFCISQPTGDIVPDHAHGLFVRDTRVLSRWELTVDDVAPLMLTVLRGDPFVASCVTRVPPVRGLADSNLMIVRRRFIGDGMREDITVRNTAGAPVRCTLALQADADFADLFEVKDGRAHGADDVTRTVDGASLRMTRRRGEHQQGTLVRAGGEPQLTPGRLCWELDLPAHGEWTASVEVVPEIDGRPMAGRHPPGSPLQDAVPARRLHDWRARSPQVSTSAGHLAATLRNSVEDLGALRIFDPDNPHRAVVAAGAPWFMAPFGRDSLLTSWMLMPLEAGLAVGTLQTLADHQGKAVDTVTEEEPGRILHEIRFGPATDFELGGRSVYYGTADATPLFVMLLGELSRWGSDGDTVDALLPHADRALDWITRYGDLDGDGFVEYQRRSERGLVNQGWKDSWDGINFADGSLAEAPIALAEVQGYCYAAFRARGFLAGSRGDDDGERYWSERAAQLKAAFNEAFWLPDRGWFAIGLDRDKRPIDALTSNIGHCLWTGIVDDDKAAAVAAHLLSDDLFSGWGIRTLARSMAAYNPLSYHNGSVWPHDNAICASGLMRYGFVAEAQRVVGAVLAASRHFDHRLPELFCGFSRAEFRQPIPYPSSCSPQAWAAAAPLLFLRTLLRFDPSVSEREVRCDPQVPTSFLPLRVSGLRVGEHYLDITVDADSWHLSGLDGTGIDLLPPIHPVAGGTS